MFTSREPTVGGESGSCLELEPVLKRSRRAVKSYLNAKSVPYELVFVYDITTKGFSFKNVFQVYYKGVLSSKETWWLGCLEIHH